MHTHISNWIKDYALKNSIKTLVVGVSGGIDSAVVSTLCAQTGITTYVLTMPINQNQSTHNLSIKHANWLIDKYWSNVVHVNIDLTDQFEQFKNRMTSLGFNNDLAFANSRSRLRMITLYQVAQHMNGIVVGTGNKVEDFGVGFFTKYGDGGVDISPIGDLLKTEVWQLGRDLGVLQEIIDAAPTDGLWDDGRSDLDQLGMTYPELEKCMELADSNRTDIDSYTEALIDRYNQTRNRNMHKMVPIPVFKKPV